MKYYKSFILFSLFALAFVSCNTDDLERDIDALKDRVTNVEAQVQQLNDEMNIIRVLLDGNKTITDYSINGDTYTLTLSNGETLTLTPGVTGGNYPSIEIGANGNWFIGGTDTGWRAQAENGEDATITPEFKIAPNPADGDKKYWYVSYDNGSTWKVLENGLAEGINTGSNPISNATVDGDNFKVTFGGKEYLIPIVKGLECAINVPEGVTDDLWLVAGGGASSFTVKVNLAEGDLVRVKAPADWNAKLSEYVAGTTEVTVTVTPPATPSECTIIVEVTHGVNSATDQIKAKTSSDSYWAEYQAGFDIRIGDVVLNKYDNPNATLIQDGETISEEGVFFIARNATVSLSKKSLKNLILIAESKDEYSKVKTANNTPAIEVALLCKGIHLLEGSENLTRVYWFNLGGNEVVKQLYFDRCKIEIPSGKNFSYFSAGVGITDLMIESCYISMSENTDKSLNFLNLHTQAYTNIEIKNNIFYCRDADTYCNFTLMMLTTGNVNGNVSINNNTFINMFNHSDNYYVKVPFEEGWSMKQNLIWYDNGEKGTVKALIGSAVANETIDYKDFINNRVFTPAMTTTLTWRPFNSTPGAGFNNTIETSTATTPFEEGFIDIEGKYTLKPEYQGIGAVIE